MNIKKYNKEYYKKNREKILEERKNNRNNINKRVRERYRENPEKFSDRSKKWRQKNPEKSKLNNVKNRVSVKFDILNYYSNGKFECACCGENNYFFLTLDHINNDGKKDRKLGISFYFKLRNNNYPEGIQILCWNCNSAKGIFGVCPHNDKNKRMKEIERFLLLKYKVMEDKKPKPLSNNKAE
ncbi:MAG: hypothetical protein AABY22_27310 [Nanoarchaeota archaeon]